MTTGQFCGVCRHWQEAERSADDTNGWGWCRRFPPQLSERMSSMLIPSLGNRADNYDPDDVATVQAVADSSLFPATWYDKFCGEFSAASVPTEPAEVSSLHGDLIRHRNSLIEADGVVADANLSTLNRLDALLMETPASNLDEVVAKLLLITANLATGHVALADDAKHVVMEARALGVEVKLA